MRLFPTLLGMVFGAALLLAGDPPAARADDAGGGAPAPIAADAAAPAPAQPATDAEAADYAQREAESPEAEEFTGGDSGLVVAIFLIGVFVLAYLFLKKEGKI